MVEYFFNTSPVGNSNCTSPQNISFYFSQSKDPCSLDSPTSFFDLPSAPFSENSKEKMEEHEENNDFNNFPEIDLQSFATNLSENDQKLIEKDLFENNKKTSDNNLNVNEDMLQSYFSNPDNLDHESEKLNKYVENKQLGPKLRDDPDTNSESFFQERENRELNSFVSNSEDNRSQNMNIEEITNLALQQNLLTNAILFQKNLFETQQSILDVLSGESHTISDNLSTEKESLQVKNKKERTANFDTEKEFVDLNRKFFIVHKDPTFGFNQIKDKINIELKTRREKPTPFIPSRFYSSLKYQIKQEIEGSFIDNSLPFLMSSCRIVDPENKKAITKDGKGCLKGTIEAALTKPPRTKKKMKGDLNVQIDGLSYYHEKKEYCLELNYFLPNELEKPVLTLLSPKFRVYARKPSKNKGQKRKINSLKNVKKNYPEEKDNAPQKKRRFQFDLFSQKLFELKNLFDKIGRAHV